MQEALQEMRVAIDALQPHGGDLAAVLGALRARLDGLVADRGVRLVWQVDELPSVDELTPSMVFSLQRIVLEAVGNALRHANAKEVQFIARTRGDGGVEIRIEDDGCGFNPEKTLGARGFADMQTRARRIGAQIEISSRPQEGTVVRMLIPRAPVARAAGSGDVKPAVPAAPAFQTA